MSFKDIKEEHYQTVTMKHRGKKPNFSLKVEACLKVSIKLLELIYSLFFQLYLEFCSKDYRYLSKLVSEGNDLERAWAYFLAQDLFKYGFFLWSKNQREEILLRINSGLFNSSLRLAFKIRAREYVSKTIPLPNLESPYYLTQFSEIPQGCLGCSHLHGKSYNGQLLVCAMHPYGQENCPDFDKTFY